MAQHQNGRCSQLESHRAESWIWYYLISLLLTWMQKKLTSRSCLQTAQTWERLQTLDHTIGIQKDLDKLEKYNRDNKKQMQDTGRDNNTVALVSPQKKYYIQFWILP